MFNLVWVEPTTDFSLSRRLIHTKEFETALTQHFQSCPKALDNVACWVCYTINVNQFKHLEAIALSVYIHLIMIAKAAAVFII